MRMFSNVSSQCSTPVYNDHVIIVCFVMAYVKYGSRVVVSKRMDSSLRLKGKVQYFVELEKHLLGLKKNGINRNCK